MNRDSASSSVQVPLLCYGLGTIGRAAAARAIRDSTYEIVAAVDADPALTGQDVGELAEEPATGVAVSPSLSEALGSAARPPAAAIHATGSRIVAVADQLRELARAGLSVSSSCEELLFPWRVAPAVADELDQVALENDVCLYATGVNPGFVFDRIPTSLLNITTELSAIRIRRIVDTLTRRAQLREKTGARLTVETYRERAKDGLGHVGLIESLHFLARATGRAIVRHERRLEPVVSDVDYESPEGPIPAGIALGQREEVFAELEGGVDVHLLLEMAIGSGPMIDAVEIDAVPSLDVQFVGGVAGMQATASALVAGTRAALGSRPGIARF